MLTQYDEMELQALRAELDDLQSYELQLRDDLENDPDSSFLKIELDSVFDDIMTKSKRIEELEAA